MNLFSVLKKSTALGLAPLLLAGCVHGEKSSFAQMFASPFAVSSEDLLGADVVAFDYGQAHDSAKKKVHPSQTKGWLPYAKRPRRQSIMASSSFRSFSLENSNGAFSEGAYELASLEVRSGIGGVPAPVMRPQFDNFVLAQHEVVQQNQDVRKIAQLERGMPMNNPADVSEQFAEVQNLRLGDYEHKTRLVFDLSAAARFDYDLDNVGNTLTVHFDDAGWSVQKISDVAEHPLIDRFELDQNAEKGVNLKIVLKKPSKMLMSGFVPSGKELGQGPRVFFDVAAL